MDNREIELKLRIAPEDVARLQRHPLIRSLSVGRAVTQKLRSVYFDTPKLALFSRDVTLRVRRVGRNHLQTVKTGSTRQTGLFSRNELDHPVKGSAPELDKIADPALRALVTGPDIATKLRPIFDTEFKRTRRRLANPEGEIGFDIDVGVIHTERGNAPICEVELELKAGTPEQLFDLARLLNKDVPLRLATASKAARGFALYAGEPPASQRAGAVELSPDMTAEQAMQTVVRACLDHLIANESAVLDLQHAEGVHQMRVALRRLRSALSLFSPLLTEASAEELKSEAKWLADELGEARNWDVFLSDVLAPVMPRFSGHVGMGDLEAAAERARAEGYRRARAALQSPRYPEFLLRAVAWVERRSWRAMIPAEALDQPIATFAVEMLDKRHRKGLKLGRSIGSNNPEALHRLRIQLKKLRYASEFFRSLFGRKASKSYIRHMADLQDVLGTLNDVAVARNLIAALLKRAAEEPEGATLAGERQNAAGLVSGWHVHTADRRARRLDTLWRDFKATDPFWLEA